MEQEEKRIFMGLKDAKDTIDTFIDTLCRNRLFLEGLSQDELIAIIMNGSYPTGSKDDICIRYFGMGYIPAIKTMRENPAAILVKLTAPR